MTLVLPEQDFQGHPANRRRNHGQVQFRAMRLALLLTAIVLASLAFVIRFNALGGSMGGFDDDEFVTLVRVDMALNGQQPGRDFADNELRGVWPSLAFEGPAVVQRIWGRNLFVHACYTLTALGLCLVAVLVLADRLSRRWLVAVIAAVLVFLTWTVPYNYQKLFAMTLGIVAIYWPLAAASGHQTSKSAWSEWYRCAPVAAAALVAGLLRHDYALCVGAGAVAGLAGTRLRPWHVPARRLAILAGLVLLVSAPSLVWLQVNGGILRYAEQALSASLTQNVNNPAMGFSPVIDLDAPFDPQSLAAFVYYACWALVVAAFGLLLWGLPRRASGVDDGNRGMGWALVVMASVVNYFLLRTTLQARFGDAIVPVVLIGPWIVGQASLLRSGAARAAARIGPPVVMTLMCVALVPIEEVPHELETGGFFREPFTAVPERFAQVRRELTGLPPREWTGLAPREGVMAAARYVAVCTAPDDRVLMGAFAEPVTYLSSRLFAAGQSYFAFSFLTTDADQQLALQRLARQSAPIAFTAFDYEHEVVKNYPLIDRHLASRYHQVGVIDFDGQPWLRVFVENDRSPARTDPVSGFPCFR